MTLQERILEIVAQNAERIFIVDAVSGTEISYGEFHQQTIALAAELRRRGIHRGDRVGIVLANCAELAVVYFACLYLGATIVPVNPNLSAADSHFILSSCKPQLIITGLSSAGRQNPEIDSVVLATKHEPVAAFKSPGKVVDLATLPVPHEFIPLENVSEYDLLVIVYTSGTTARPKGLAHKIGRMFHNAMVFAETMGIDRETRFYSTLSMAYMGGFYNLLILPFLCGASVVIDHVFDARSSLNFWEKASRYQANTLWLAPTVMSILLRMDRGKRGEEFCRGSVSKAFVGFAPLSLKLKEDFETRYGLRLIENYGLSETLFVTARSWNSSLGSGYVGEPLAGIELRAGEDRSTARGSEGEIQIRTPALMAGYFDDGGTLVEVDSASWFSTGDVGYLDENGSLFITGRKKDVIIRGGVNVSPAAIEEVLLHATSVADAAVVSIPHELYGEDIVAVLKLEPETELESILDAVMAHARQNLAVHQQPARYIAIDDFPKTANGKVQKSRLREMVMEKLHMGSGSMLAAVSKRQEREPVAKVRE